MEMNAAIMSEIEKRGKFGVGWVSKNRRRGTRDL